MKQLSFWILNLMLLASCQKTASVQDINATQTKQHLEQLANDSMKGRKAGTEYAQKAAAYIADQFQKIGLEPFQEESNFLQSFNLYNSTPTSITASVNGSTIPKEQLFFFCANPTITINQTTDIEIIRLDKDADFYQTVQSYSTLYRNTLYLVDASHQADFEKYQKRFQNSLRTFGNKQELPLIVWMLTPPIMATEISEIELSTNSQVETTQLSNVVAVLPGKSKKNEYVLFSAHYDHIGILDAVKGDSIANGADDDASGTTAVMSLAAHYKSLGNNERSLIFACFTAEEIGLFGSKYFTQQIDPEQVIAGVNIEMIGKVSKFGKNEAFLTGYERSDLGKVLQKNIEGTHFQLHPDPYTKYRLFYRSDNASLAKLGVPAHTVSTSQIDSDKHYHAVTDEVNTLDIKNMTAIINLIGDGCQGLVMGTDTPSRIEKQ